MTQTRTTRHLKTIASVCSTLILANCASQIETNTAERLNVTLGDQERYNPSSTSDTLDTIKPAQPIKQSDKKDDFEFFQNGKEGLNTAQESRAARQDNTPSIELDLIKVDASDAIADILGSTLETTYVLEYEPEGQISLQTAGMVSRQTAIDLLNTALASVNATLIQADNYFVVKRLSDRAERNQVQFLGDEGFNIGEQTRVVPLNYVSAKSLESIFASLPGQSVKVSSDAGRNLLILNSESVPLDDLAQIANLFDQNWLSEMSFAATPVKFTAPEQIIEELNQILGTQDTSAKAGMLRFLALPRLNAVVSISRNPEYLKTAEAWIQRLDRSQTKPEQKFLIIPVQHRDAEEVAELLSVTFSDLFDPADLSRSGGANLEPGSSPAVAGSAMGLNPAISSPQPKGLGKLRVSTDTSNNTIIAYAHPDQLDMIEAMVQKIDVAPKQIYLETTIAEVTLNNDLAFGLSWFFENGDLSGGYSDIASGAVGNRFPGFSALISGPDARLALSAVSSLTDVKVLSSPSIMVLNNKTATLQVGDQVPIVTQSSVSIGDADAPIINSVSMRDTGIILNVTPRVNDEGTVVLDIEQEVSNVISTVSSGIDSPTIQQRRLTTTVMVENGKSIALGGLIRERISNNESKVPILGDIPLIGPAMFKSEKDVIERTELLLLITPKVVRSEQDGLSILKDLANDMSSIELSFSSQHPEQDEVTKASDPNIHVAG